MPDASLRFPFNPIQPGAYSAIDASSLQSGERGPLSPITAHVGDAKGGTPNTPLYFRDPQTLRNVLRSGDAFTGARLSLLGGAPVVCVVRAGSGITSASSALAGATGAPITLTALDAGAWTNSIKRTVEADNKVTVSYTDPNGVTYREVFALGAAATPQQIVDAINGKNATVAASAYVKAAVTTGTMPLTASAEANLAGGADAGSFVAGDWTNALSALETEDVSIVVPATGDSTVHAQVQTHCEAMSTPAARKERTMVVGGTAGETPIAQVTRMGALRKSRSQLVYPGVSLFDENGTLTAYPPFHYAALVAGMHCGLPDPATSLTHQRVPIVDVERRLSTIAGGDLDRLLTAGVTPTAPAPGTGFWIVDSLSGYNTDESFRDFHKIRTADECARRLRVRLEDLFVGRKSLDGSPGDLADEANAELVDQVSEELLRAYQPVTVTARDARTFLVTAPVMLPDTVKFVLLTVALQSPNTLSTAAPAGDEFV